MSTRNHVVHSATSPISSFFSARSRLISRTFWFLTVVSVLIWIKFDLPGWDIVFYRNAIAALHIGHDPYVDAMAVQREFHATLAQHPNDFPPYSYVYSPMTLPLLRLIGALPVWFAGTLYWGAIVACVLISFWVIWKNREDTDTPFLRIIIPIAIFFPGLLVQDTVLSGNVAFILYGIVLAGAAYGWRKNRWLWCYAAILIASCFKAPLLSLLAIPLFSARKQWLPTGITAFLGIVLFAIQALIVPSLFHHFLQAVELQFSYNHDFGSSPDGIFSYILVNHGRPYSPYAEIFYFAYAAGLFATLLYFSKQFLQHKFSLSQWIPVLLLGTILLNPRIMEYDLSPLAVPMALIGWRFVTRLRAPVLATFIYLGIFIAANFIAGGLHGTWKPTECLFLIAFFIMGCSNLLYTPRKIAPRDETPFIRDASPEEAPEAVENPVLSTF